MDSRKGFIWDSGHSFANSFLDFFRFCHLDTNLFPPFSLLDFGLIEYVFLPGLFTWFFTKQLLDGKAPHRFFIRAIQYHLSPHYLNRYKEVSDVKKPYKYASKVGYRQLSYSERGETDDRISY